MFIYMPKIYFINYILKNLKFDWPAAFWPITQDPKFCQTWD